MLSLLTHHGHILRRGVINSDSIVLKVTLHLLLVVGRRSTSNKTSAP